MAEPDGLAKVERKARLLVVDDEPSLRAGLQDLFSAMGYHVEAVGSGRKALALLENTSYDLMILDIRMPGMDGVEVMKRARQAYPELSIIMLTANATLESAIAAVRFDAADYLLKPFNPEDLVATVSTVLRERAERLRRQHVLDMIGEVLDTLHQTGAPVPSSISPVPQEPPVAQEHFLRVGCLTLDRQKRLAMREDDPAHPVELTEGEAAVLAVLMEHPNQVYSCAQLARTALGYELDRWEAESLIRPSIHRLRRKIETSPNAPRLIRIVRGRGYFFASA